MNGWKIDETRGNEKCVTFTCNLLNYNPLTLL